MTVVGGSRGVVKTGATGGAGGNAISTILNWNLTRTMSDINFRAANTDLAPQRLRGITTWSGSFTQNIGDAAPAGTPVAMPRDFVDFLGFVGPDSGTSGGTGTSYWGKILIDSVALNFDFSSGGPLQYVYNFTGILDLTKADGDVFHDDVSNPNVYQVCDAKVEIDSDAAGSGAYAELTDLTSVGFTLSADNKYFSNSGTILGTSPPICWQDGKPGPIDWTLSLGRQRQSFEFEPDLVVGIKIYVSATEFWDLQFAKIMEQSGLEVNPDTGDLVAYTENLSMTAWDESNTTQGGIITPDTTPWWPNTF